MDAIAQLAVIFAVCLAGEGVAGMLPVDFPGSVISMVLLMALLLTGAVKPRHIDRTSNFLVEHMAFVFVPPCVSAVEHAGAILENLGALVLICVVTTPVVYCLTAWSVQAVMRWQRRRGARGRG